MAASFLKAHGYCIEALNWRRKSYEIDIVARRGRRIAFVEVKSSSSETFGPPELRVTISKQKRIARAAAEYLASLDYEPEEIRFDVIAVTWPAGRAPRIEHLQSAFTIDEG